jgi:hypothetical protein
MLFRGTFSLESVHKRPALAVEGKNRRLVDGQLEKKEKEKGNAALFFITRHRTYVHHAIKVR